MGTTHRKLFVGFLFTFLLFATHVEGADFPQPRGFVSDFAGVIAAPERQKLEGLLTNFERQSGIEIAIVTMESVEEGDVDGFAVRLYETWGIGKKGRDEGLLILAAIVDRRARIEVGYGLEGIIPDALAGRILREVILPQFKQGAYGEGLLAGTLVLVQKIAQAKDISLEQLPHGPSRLGAKRKPAGPLAWILRIIIMIGAVILFIKNPFLFFILLGFGGGGGTSRGGFGGGFGGFGGGLSGGGGASGSW